MNFVYYKSEGREFIENGLTKIRVTTMDMRPSPATKGRILKIMVVNEVLSISPFSTQEPLRHGSALAVSFPPDRVNAPSYRWRELDPNEEIMVPIQIKLSKP